MDARLSGTLSPAYEINGKLHSADRIGGVLSTPRSVVETDYSRLSNKPAINDHELRDGNNMLDELGIGVARNTDIDRLF